MAYTRTLAQLRTSITVRGSYEGSDDITPAVLLEVINDALEETYMLNIECDDDYYVKVGTPFQTVIGTDTYSLPSDFYELRKVELQVDSSRWRKLYPVPLDGANLVQSWGTTVHRYRYRLSSAGLTLFPTPNSGDTIRVYYLPLAPQLANDTDQVTFDRPVEQKLVLHIALRDCLQRQNLDTSALDVKIDKLSKQLRSIADSHDSGEPFYLGDHGPHSDEGW